MVYIWHVNFKWYIGVLIVVVSYFVVEQQSIDVPNQEIVLTFSGSNDSQDYQQAIVDIKIQLEDIEAEQVTVSRYTNGSLKVSYYSDRPLQSVKNHLFEVSVYNDLSTSLRFKNKTGNKPFSNNLLDYQIDIYEISDELVSGLDHESKSYFELKQDFNRGSQVHYFTLPKFTITLYNELVGVKEKANGEKLLAFDTFSYQIPEVRAGPHSYV
jgi:hypothetical protein